VQNVQWHSLAAMPTLITKGEVLQCVPLTAAAVCWCADRVARWCVCRRLRHWIAIHRREDAAAKRADADLHMAAPAAAAAPAAGGAVADTRAGAAGGALPADVATAPIQPLSAGAADVQRFLVAPTAAAAAAPAVPAAVGSAGTAHGFVFRLDGAALLQAFVQGWSELEGDAAAGAAAAAAAAATGRSGQPRQARGSTAGKKQGGAAKRGGTGPVAKQVTPPVQ
jgi:hypothetical protein